MHNMKKLIDRLIEKKANGNSFQEMNVKMKLLLKGIPVQHITEDTQDDPKLIKLIHETAKDFNVELDLN